MTQATRLDAIQIARALAAMLVVYVHAIGAAADAGLPHIVSVNAAVFGSSGVDLFFVISGFVMAHVLARGPTRPTAFLRARVARILPLFGLVSVAFLLINPERTTFAWQSVMYSITVLPVFDGTGYHAPALYVGWTLGFEAAFYALVALAAAWGGGGRRAVRILAGLTLAAAAAGLVATPPWAPLRLLANPLQAEFALGIGLWLAHDAGLLRDRAGPLLLAGTAALVLGAGFGFALPLTAHFADAVSGVSSVARTIDWGVPWAMVLGGLLAWSPHGRLADGARALGDASYALYLTHPFALAWAMHAAQAGWIGDTYAFLALAVPGTILLSLAVHRLIERPLLRAMAARRTIGATAGSAASYSRAAAPNETGLWPERVTVSPVSPAA